MRYPGIRQIRLSSPVQAMIGELECKIIYHSTPLPKFSFLLISTQMAKRFLFTTSVRRLDRTGRE
jgi:hypothetical protein